MSTAIDMMNHEMLDDRGPWNGAITSNTSASGPVRSGKLPAQFDLEEKAHSPQGGIDYIDQSVGGYLGPRGDAFTAPTSGIRSGKMRFAPFNGDFIGTTVQNPNRVQGMVGRSNATTVAQRATSAQDSDTPDSGKVIAAFTSPAVAAFFRKNR